MATSMPSHSTDQRRTKRSGAPPSASDRFQQALADLAQARERATGDARDAIDAASDRVREVAKDVTERAQGELDDVQRALERAGGDVRRELGLLAVRIQDSPDALTAMATEIRKRKARLTAETKG